MRDARPAPGARIAVIGGGISGLGAAALLSGAHRVTLFESDDRLGGHARTVMAGRTGQQPVDTGFIVFNHANYPHLTALFDRLGVETAKSRMGFGVSVDGGRFEYALSGLSALFAQPGNALRPAFLRMVRDIFRFNAGAEAAVTGPDMTVGDLLQALGTGEAFRDYYLTPFSGAIWSSPKAQMLDFPAEAMIRFFRNHHLLSATGQHQWYTVKDGSARYVERLAAMLRAQQVDIRLKAPVQAVRRNGQDVMVRAWGGQWEVFDQVVLATHSDDSLRMLDDADLFEQAALGAIAYRPNQVTLHADPSLMPKRRKVWSSWNYAEAAGGGAGEIDVTYWMNALQPIPADDPLFVTLNTRRPIREELIHDQVTLRHPVYDAGAFDAQGRIARRNGRNRTWFCGAWMKNGFHEDGLASAVDVARAMGVEERPWGAAPAGPCPVGPAAMAAE
ncbi:NAD(P)/FAD-dependent oxidoreductase [Chachezhania sediminis]|uniref:NAD(P)/FAD-dependent oxidoreductase n=1 Tax=Chachezhania sediminis TaxID=2599291 RepID=UPI00131AFB3A|nr:FAD-dependent oxidoreductase [Chachezhania sediminis]